MTTKHPVRAALTAIMLLVAAAFLLVWGQDAFARISNPGSSSGGGGGSSVGYPFPLPGNATSTSTQFNGGLTAFASSTIGSGLAAGGLTVLGTATTTNAVITGLASTLLKTNGLGQVVAAVAGTDYLATAAIFGYPFLSNATSTMLTFSGGLLSTASTTVGAGSQVTGLTISGGATTTGNALVSGTFAATGNATFSGNLNVASGKQYQYNGVNLAIAQTGNQNWYFGNAGNLTGSGTYNVALGNGTLPAIAAGSSNTAAGGAAAEFTNSGANNVAIGFNALDLNTSGSRNVALGYKALFTNDSTGGNIAIGYQAGYSLTGNSNIILGQNVEAPVAGNSGQLNIGNVIFATGLYNNSATKSNTPIAGNVGIGTSTAFANFQVTAGNNSTTTMEVGQKGSNKGSCVKLYDATGTGWYYTPTPGTGALTVASPTSCASVTGF